MPKQSRAEGLTFSLSLKFTINHTPKLFPTPSPSAALSS